MPSDCSLSNLCKILTLKWKLYIFLLLVGVLGRAVAHVSHADDLGESNRVQLLAGNADRGCAGYFRFLQQQNDSPSVCEALMQHTSSAPNELLWHPVDYHPHIEDIERVYEAFEQIQPFSFAQRELGPKFPGLRSKQNRDFYEGIGDIFWSKFGDLILRQYEIGRLSVESTKVNLGPDKREYELFRIPIWEPTSESQLATKPLTCGSHSDVPSYYIFADKENAPKLASYLLKAGRSSDVVTFDGTIYYGFFDESPSGKGSIILRKLIDGETPNLPAESACTIVVGQ